MPLRRDFFQGNFSKGVSVGHNGGRHSHYVRKRCVGAMDFKRGITGLEPGMCLSFGGADFHTDTRSARQRILC